MILILDLCIIFEFLLYCVSNPIFTIVPSCRGHKCLLIWAWYSLTGKTTQDSLQQLAFVDPGAMILQIQPGLTELSHNM